MTKCEKCSNKGTVFYNPMPTHPHIVAEWPCPDCRVIISRELCDEIMWGIESAIELGQLGSRFVELLLKVQTAFKKKETT